MGGLGTSIHWENAGAMPIALALAAASFALLAWAYGAQSRMMGPSARWTLPALRGVAIAALALSAIQPVLTSTATQSQRGAVVFVVDASASMAVTDARDPASRVALARALGRVQPPTTDESVEPVRRRLKEITTAMDDVQAAQDEARLALAAGRVNGEGGPKDRVASARQVLADLRKQLSGSAEAAAADNLGRLLRAIDIDDSPKPSELRRRVGAAMAELSSAGARRDATLYRTDASVRAAADDVAASSRGSLAMWAARKVVDALPPDVPVYVFAAGERVRNVDFGAGDDARPTSSYTDDRAAIDAALSAVGDVAVRGVVLVGDGRQVLRPTSSVDGGTSRATPIFALNVAPQATPRDVAVAIASAPDRVSPGETAVVRVAVRARGGAAASPAVKPFDVNLKSPGDGDAVRQTKPATPDRDGNAAVEFNVKFDRPGVQELSASVAPVADEVTTANNTATRRVRVVSGKVKVAAYAGTPSWDFQYLRNALQRSAPWADLRDAVLGVADGAPPMLPLSPAEILEQDVLILCDVDVAALSPAQWDAVSQLVSTRGGAVIVFANDERVLNGYARQPQAATLLPLRPGLRYAWRTWSGERPTIRVAPSTASTVAGASVLRLVDDVDAGDPGAIARQWQERPPLFRVMPLIGLKPAVEPLLTEPDSGAAVVTEQRFGRGRSLFVGLNETWRWRTHGGDRVHDRFLLQLVRHAADEPYAARSADVALDVDAVVARPGASVNVRARVLSGDAAATQPQGIAVQVRRDGVALPDLTLTDADDGATGRYRGTIAGLSEGRYELSVAGKAGAPPAAVTFVVEPDAASESADVSPDPEFLRRLADVTGGQYVTLDDLAVLPPLLSDAGDARHREVRRALWDGPTLFLLVLGCLTTEWALRKRFGLA